MKAIHKFLTTMGILLFSSCADKGDKVPEMFLNAEMSSEGKEALVREYRAGKATWDAALAFLGRPDLDTLKAGRHEIPGTEAFANVIDYETRLEGDFEYHRKYIDVQYVVTGGEKCGIVPLTALEREIEAYSENGDSGLMNGIAEGIQVQEVLLKTGMVGIYFPFDAHMPNMAVGRPRRSHGKSLSRFRWQGNKTGGGWQGLRKRVHLRTRAAGACPTETSGQRPRMQ